MAESSDSQNPLNCPICIHILKTPVTTTCGHSFCMGCLNECWDLDDQKGVYSCPQCRQTFSPRPDLSKNTVLAAVVKRMKTEAPNEETAKETSPPQSFVMAGDVECDICTETKLKAIKSCLACLASYCESHIQTHYTSAALKRHKLVNASPHLLDQICSQHDKLLELYCVQDQQLICMQCALINHQNHSMTSPAAARQKIQEKLKSNQDVLQEDMHQREIKSNELKQSIDSYKHSAKKLVEHSEKMFTEHISLMGKRKAEIIKMICAQEKAEVIRVEEITIKLNHEINDLKKRHEELGKLSQMEDDICFIQNFSSLSSYQCANLSTISIRRHLTFEEIETVVSELKKLLDDLCEQDIVRISEKVATLCILMNNEKIPNYLPSKPKTREEFLIYSCNLNMNSSSACKGLSVKKKSVSYTSVHVDPFMDRGFAIPTAYAIVQRAYTYQVLCEEKLSGRCYFEVVCGGTGCSIAFSYNQISQGGQGFNFGSNNRSWKCDFPAASLCVLHGNKQTNISLVSKIGVFLDQTSGTVSFYNVSDAMTLLHRIQATFNEPVYPGFSLQRWGSGSSVTICDLPSPMQNE